MATYLDVLIYSFLGGLLSLVGGLLLIRKQSSARKLALYGTPFAAGALLAAVFMDLLPEGVTADDTVSVFIGCLVGFLGFFVFQRILGSVHHHHDENEKTDHLESSRLSIIIGNTAHNALDGVAIGAAFLVNIPTGIVTTIAIAAHEIPHEIGDFALLLSRKMSRKAVVLINVFAAVLSTLVALLVFGLGGSDKLPVNFLLGLSAGFLLYISASDIIPTINTKIAKSPIKDWQLLMLLLGVVVVSLVIRFAEGFIVA